MQLHTKDYGVIDYEEKDLFHFPDGLFGFSEVQHYLPLCLNEEEDSTILLLQGVENPDVLLLSSIHSHWILTMLQTLPMKSLLT